MTVSEINQWPVGAMYRVANVFARFTDFIRVPLLLFALFYASFLVVTWPMKWVYPMLTKLGLAEHNFPSGLYIDMSDLALVSMLRLLMVAIPLLFLSIRDFGLFPIRTKLSLTISITLSFPFVWWLYSIGKFMTSNERSAMFGFGEAIMLPVTIVDDLFVSMTPGEYLAPVHFTLVFLVLIVNLSSFVYLLSFLISIVGHSTGRTSIIGERYQYPGIVKQFISTIGRMWSGQKTRCLGIVVLLLSASLIGSLIVLANRLISNWVQPLISEVFRWLSLTGYFLDGQESQFVHSILGITLAPFILAIVTFFFSVKLYTGRWNFLMPVLFLTVQLPLLYFANMLSKNYFMLLVFYVNVLSLIAILPLILKAWDELRYIAIISHIAAIKKLQSNSGVSNLLLRPFALDQADIPSSFGIRLPLVSRLKRRTRLEEVVSRSAYLFGPLMTIGNPSEKRAELGAIREYFTETGDTRWQEYIETSIQRARHIFFMIDKSEFTVWETDQILKYGVAEKLIFIVPDKKGAASSYFRANPRITESIGLTKEKLDSIDKDKILTIVPRNRTCTLIRGAGRTVSDYLLAIDRAITVSTELP